MLGLAHACGELLLGEATGGQGLPGVGFIPELFGDVLFWLFPVPGFELDDPAFGVVPVVPLALPGKVPQGDPLGEPPGLFGVLGLIVEGCVVPPGVGVAGDVDPGTVVFGVPLDEEGDPGAFGVCGVVCGVAVPAGGVAVPAGGVAGEPGVELCPAEAEPLGGTAPPEGVLCATAQLAQHNTTDSNVSFLVDIY